MYKLTSHLSNAKLVLVRKKVGDCQCALFILRAPNRNYAHHQTKEDCPPATPTPPRSRKFLLGTIGATVLTGAAVVYAKSNPEARNWLSSNAPWADNFVSLIYEENQTYGQFIVNQWNKVTSSLSVFVFGKEGRQTEDVPSRVGQDLNKPVKFGKQEYKLPPPAIKPLYVEPPVLDKPDIETPATLIQTEKCEPVEPPPVIVTKDLVELENEMHENTKAAIDNYKKATDACAEYIKALYMIMDASADDMDTKFFDKLAGAHKEREDALNAAKAAAAKARCSIEVLSRKIEAGVQVPNQAIAATQRYMKQFRIDLLAAENKYKTEIDKAVLSDKYWNKVEAARNAFKQELQALFPGLNLSSRKLLLQGDTDLLLVYMLRQVQFLQKELAEIQTLRDVKLNRAIDCNDQKEIIDCKVEEVLKKERVEREKQYQLQALQIQAENNRKMKEQLKKQLEIQHEILQEKVSAKEKEVLAKFSRTISEQVEKERTAFKQDLAIIAGKLKAIEQTLTARQKADEEARRSQSLWAAGEALLAATRRNCPNTRVENELKAIEKAAGKNDKLVESVLKGIPDDVRKKGVVTENALRLSYDRMERIAMKVALVGKDGAALPVYFLSWIQSLLLFSKFAEIPKDELDNLPTDFTKLDTFDIMQRARYYMEHNNIGAALRYVNLLQGASRAAAKNWADSARHFLETRQAAEAVMAHASAAGLLYM